MNLLHLSLSGINAATSAIMTIEPLKTLMDAMGIDMNSLEVNNLKLRWDLEETTKQLAQWKGQYYVLSENKNCTTSKGKEKARAAEAASCKPLCSPGG